MTREDLDKRLTAIDERMESGHAASEHAVPTRADRRDSSLDDRIRAIHDQVASLGEGLTHIASAVREAEARRRTDVRVELSHSRQELADELTAEMAKIHRSTDDPFADLVRRHIREVAPTDVLEIGIEIEQRPLVESLVDAHGEATCRVTTLEPTSDGSHVAVPTERGPFDFVVVHTAPASPARSPRIAWYEVIRPHLADDSVILLADHERDRSEVLERWARDPHLTVVRTDTHTAPEEQGGVALAYRRRRTSRTLSAERFVVIKGRFGMGGRLAVLSTATAYAERTGRRLVVDWNDPAYWTAGGPDVYSSLFEAPLSEPLDPIQLIGASVHPASWRPHVEKFTREFPGRIVPYELAFNRAPNDDVDADVVVITRDDPRLPDLGPRLRRTVPTPALRSEIDQYTDNFRIRQAIGVHVRHGNGEFLVDPPDLTWYSDKIREVRSAHPDAPIFLATDGPTVVDQLTSQFDQVVTVPKWYPPPRTGSLHHHRSNPDPLRSAGHAVIDIWLLSRCRHLVLSPGGFSKVARLLSDAPPSNVSVYPGAIHAPRPSKRGWINPP